MNKTFSPKLVDLYCDIAAHLLTLEFVQSMPVWQEWLAERVLTGLPDAAAYRQIIPERSKLFSNPHVAILNGFSWIDSDSHKPGDFACDMRAVVTELRLHGFPPFPREFELADL